MLFRRWKTIEYRGGVVTFRIPRDWVEKYDPEGGGEFYSTGPSSSTLRLNLHLYGTPSPVDRESAGEILRRLAKDLSCDCIVHPMPSGDAYIKHVFQGQEDGTPLVFYCWIVANVIPPLHHRLAVFTFTTVALEREQALRDIKWLEREIRNCRFACELGVGGDWQPS